MNKIMKLKHNSNINKTTNSRLALYTNPINSLIKASKRVIPCKPAASP